ncbi:MAG: N-acetylmuramoyl-L-alanine amidase [Deltaproteobacteria bacterium]
MKDGRCGHSQIEGLSLMPQGLPMMRIVTGAILVLLLVTSPPIPAWAKTPCFSETYSALAGLSRDPNGTRDQWLRVIKDFVRIYRGSDDHAIKMRSLFLSGKASLGLYRRSLNMEDLDRAIRYLKDFTWINRHDPASSNGLKELKRALALKENATGVRSGDESVERAANKRKPPVGELVLASWQASQTQTKKPVESPPEVEEPLIPRARSPFTVTGNPFCPTGTRNLLRIALPLRRASIAPRTMTDASPRTRTHVRTGKRFVVVIDPGHGGKDPGAVSPDGLLKEKDVVLDVSRRLKKIMEREHPDIDVFLTRADDRFLSLEQRTALANSLNADLFLSVHCNASREGLSRGIETYYLSKASSRKAMEVAARENGIPLVKMSDLEATFLDLTVTSKRTESHRLASIIHNSLIQRLFQNRRISEDRGVKRAPFYVLLGAKMPAILVECAFISHSVDQRRLQSPHYLDRLAEGLAKGTCHYLHNRDEKS